MLSTSKDNMKLSFDDVLLVPKFSTIRSRKDCDTTSLGLNIPIISSNMDTVTESVMCTSMKELGGIGCLHRFWSIQKNVDAYKASPKETWVSVGVGDREYERVISLFNAGACYIVLDVAHGAASHVVEQTKRIQALVKDHAAIMVGNFATGNSINDFLYHLGNKNVKAFKVGIGGGSACITRVVTGSGMPTLASIMDCRKSNVQLIADGGIRTSGDFAKAIGAGASAVMMGGVLAGTTESPGGLYTSDGREWNYSTKFYPGIKRYKKYRGSASMESYEVQSKTDRTAEGESFYVPYTGPVENIIKAFHGGLQSAMSYVGAHDIKEFQELCEFIQVTTNGTKESGPHGKEF